MTDSPLPAGGAAPEPPVAPHSDAPESPAATGSAGFPPSSDPIPDLADVIARPVKSSGQRSSSILLAVAGAIAIAGLAFAGGRLTAPAATASTARGQFPGYVTGQGYGGGANIGGRAGFGGVSLSGTVTAITPNSITLTLTSGSSVTVALNSSTSYHTAAPATASAVTVGSSVKVTPGTSTVAPTATRDPNATPGAGLGGLSFGAATDVTVTTP